MQIANPQEHVGCNVRMRPHNGQKHFGRGRLVRIEGQYGVVRPFQRHRKEERVPLSDLHTWAAGNPVNMEEQQNNSSTPAAVGDAVTEDAWVVADLDNARFYASPWAGFKPELNRAKVYTNLSGANHAAAMLRRRPAGEVGKITILTVQEAEQFFQERSHPQLFEPPAPAAPPQAASLLPDLSKASPEDLRAAAGILARLADAEAMHREASAELQKVQTQWQELASRISSPQPAGENLTAAENGKP